MPWLVLKISVRVKSSLFLTLSIPIRNQKIYIFNSSASLHPEGVLSNVALLIYLIAAPTKLPPDGTLFMYLSAVFQSLLRMLLDDVYRLRLICHSSVCLHFVPSTKLHNLSTYCLFCRPLQNIYFSIQLSSFLTSIKIHLCLKKVSL